MQGLLHRNALEAEVNDALRSPFIPVPVGAVSEKTAEAVYRNVFKLIAQQRLLAASETLRKLREYLDDPAVQRKSSVKRLRRELETTHAEQLEKLEVQTQEALDALDHLDAGTAGDGEGGDESEWIFSHEYLGIRTDYKMHDDGTLSVKLEGVMEDCPLFELLAVVKEVDLFSLWVPFCNRSEMVKKIGVVELLAHFNISIPFLSRDTCLYAYGVDMTYERNALLILGRSVEEYENVRLPFLDGWTQDRMVVRGFHAYVELLSPTKIRTTVVGRVDPRAHLPQYVINFVMRKLAGVFLYILQKQAAKTASDPDSVHARRIRNDTDFYVHWLLPKFRSLCAFKGWETPHIGVLEGLVMSTIVPPSPNSTVEGMTLATAADDAYLDQQHQRQMQERERAGDGAPRPLLLGTDDLVARKRHRRERERQHDELWGSDAVAQTPTDGRMMVMGDKKWATPMDVNGRPASAAAPMSAAAAYGRGSTGGRPKSGRYDKRFGPGVSGVYYNQRYGEDTKKRGSLSQKFHNFKRRLSGKPIDDGSGMGGKQKSPAPATATAVALSADESYTPDAAVAYATPVRQLHTEFDVVGGVPERLQSRFHSWRQRREQVRRTARLRRGVVDVLMDYFIWPILPMMPFLPFSGFVWRFLRDNLGFAGEMLVLGVVLQAMLFLVGYFGFDSVLDMQDRKLHTLGGTKSWILKLLGLVGLLISLFSAVVATITAYSVTAMKESPAHIRDAAPLWTEVAAKTAHVITMTSTIVLVLLLLGAQLLLRVFSRF